jgi:hypothetical protein
VTGSTYPSVTQMATNATPSTVRRRRWGTRRVSLDRMTVDGPGRTAAVNVVDMSAPLWS